MKRRVTLVVALLLVALSDTAVGVTARSEDVEPVGFTGSLHEVAAADDCGRDATYEVIDDVLHTRDYCIERWMGTSDPRFTGTYTTFGNSDEYRDEDVVPAGVMLGVWTAVHRIENDEGAWHSEATVAAAIDDVREGAEVVTPTQTIVFIGTGDYEGLTAILWLPQFINAQVRGVIFPGSPPPAPQAEFVESQPADQ